MLTEALFHPYKVEAQSGSSLHLKASSGMKFVRLAFLFAPLLMLVVGIALYASEREIKFLFILGGIALLELVVFSFIKLPGDVQLDRMGLTVQQVSIRGSQQVDVLWSDVDRIRQRTQSTKNGKALNYEAVLKDGKRLRFLSFNNYNPKKQSVDFFNALLRQISHKEIEIKA